MKPQTSASPALCNDMVALLAQLPHVARVKIAEDIEARGTAGSHAEYTRLLRASWERRFPGMNDMLAKMNGILDRYEFLTPEYKRLFITNLNEHNAEAGANFIPDPDKSAVDRVLDGIAAASSRSSSRF